MKFLLGGLLGGALGTLLITRLLRRRKRRFDSSARPASDSLADALGGTPLVRTRVSVGPRTRVCAQMAAFPILPTSKLDAVLRVADVMRAHADQTSSGNEQRDCWGNSQQK